MFFSPCLLLVCLLTHCLTQEEQQYSLPPSSSLALSWSQSGQPDLETLLASTGVTGSRILQAMTSAHCRMARACADAHRKAPGLREVKTWAGAAGVLLQQGWCLSPALWQGWVQAYIRSYAVTEGLVAEGQGAFLAICEQLQLQAPAAACTQDTVSAVQDATVDDMLVGEQDAERRENQLAVVPAAGWPNQLLRPCQWPVWVGLQELASGSAAAAAARDVSLPVWLLAQALAADMQVAAATGGVPAALDLLQQLPASQQAVLPVQVLCSTAGLSSSTGLQLLPRLVATASLSCLLQPPPVAGSSDCKLERLQQQLSTVAAAAARLQQYHGGNTFLSSQRLVQLVQQLPAVLAQQPWHSQLQQLLPEMAQQQVLMSAMQLPQPQLGLLLPVMQQAACHAAVEAAVAAAAAQANSTGAASPYQQSVWRARHPQERARSEASHPAVDCLQPCLALVAEAEAAAVLALTGHLQDSQWQFSSSGSTDPQWQKQMQAVERLQMARFECWAACHGSMQQHYGSGARTTTVSTEVQPERLAWAWAQLSKRMQQLLSTGADLFSAESAGRWEYMSQQMAAALQLDSSSAKPLLWRLGGHPQLPPTMRLLQAQRRVSQLAGALAVAGGTGFRADARGEPAALVAAGLDWHALLQQAVAAAKVQQAEQQQEVQQPVGPNGITMFGEEDPQQQKETSASASAGVDFDVLLKGLEGGSAVGPEAELREQLAQAATAVLSCSTSFRHSVAQGLALLGFFPHMQLLQQQGSAAPGAGQHKVSAVLAMQAHALLQVADTLQEQASTLLLPVLTEMLLSPQKLQHEAAGAAAVVAALKQREPAGSSVLGQVLPARAMVSSAVRQMQVDLQPLVQLSALQEQQQLNTKSLSWLLQATLVDRMAGNVVSARTGAGAVLIQQLEGLEGSLLQALSSSRQSSCQGSAAAAVPYLQLSWLLSSMLDNQQWPLSGPLVQQVLPGLLHDAWYSWQTGLWAGATGAGDALQAGAQTARGAGFSRALPMPLQALSSPLALHVAAQTVAGLQVCSAVAADGTSKAPRLQQLSLAVRHMLQRPGQACSAQSAADQHWASLAVLLPQLLLVHSSSFEDAADVSLLQQLTQQMLAWSSSSVVVKPSAADAQQWLQQCSSLLSRSSHTVLAACAQQLLLPCAEAIVGHLTAAAAPGPSQHQQQEPWYRQVAQQGWASLLLGCARLQLVAPPSGVDPAGKYGHKAEAVVRWVTEQLDPAVCVQHLQQQLPGGLDAAPAIKQLLQDRHAFSARLQQLRSRCVPRPDPPQYHHLQQEVSAFSRGLADPARLLAVGRALLAPEAQSAQAAAAAAHEASSWDGSAAAWSQRMQAQFGLYLDILQPVLLAVLEIRQGLCLLAAGSKAAQQAAAVEVHAHAAAGAGARNGSQQLVTITAGLLSFPPPLAPAALELMQSSSSGGCCWALCGATSSMVPAMPASMLAAPALQQLTGTLVHQQQQALQGPGRSETSAAASADLAGFSWQLQCAHAALLVSVQELLAAGPAAAAAAACAGSVSGSGCLGRVHGLMQQLVAAWQSVKEFEAQAAAEAAQLFKHKTQTKTFLTEEVSQAGAVM